MRNWKRWIEMGGGVMKALLREAEGNCGITQSNFQSN